MTIPPQYLQPCQAVGIVYWGRSGTLLVHSLLDSHPDVLSCNGFFWLYSSQMDTFLASEGEKDQSRLVDFICEAFPYLFEHWPAFFPEMFRGEQGDLPFGTDRGRFLEAFREYLSHFPSETPFRSLPEGHTVHSFVLQAIHVAYAIAQGQALTSQNPTIVWQTHFWQADYFRERFPELRILSVVRHPLRSYDSWQQKAFVDERVPSFWFYHSVRLRQMMEFISVPPELADRCRAIRFEDIHNRTAGAMRALAAWLNIGWDDCLLESTFDGERYWGVKGGCMHLSTPGKVPPREALVTGTRRFDEAQIKLKYLGVVDRLRMRAFCTEAYVSWQYGHRPLWCRMTSLAWLSQRLLLLCPSKLDRLSFGEDLRLERTQQKPSGILAWTRFAIASAKDFVRKKWQFYQEMLAIKHAQRGWPSIQAIVADDALEAGDEYRPNITPDSLGSRKVA